MKTEKVRRRINNNRPERDSEVFNVLRALRGYKITDIAREGGISPSTIRKWYIPVKEGGTRYPQHYTMTRALYAVGKRFTIIKAK